MMLKSIAINFPEFGLDINEEFKKGINIIEGPNGYGKTTIINTIISFMIGKFPGLRTNPSGNAIIETDQDKYILGAKKWIGRYDASYLGLYAFVGKFFEIPTTTEQRKVLIDLLELDYDKFAGDAIGKLGDDYQLLMDHSESELKKMFKDAQAKEEVLLDDIMKYKSFIKEFEDQNFDDVIFYLKNKDSLIEKINQDNSIDTNAQLRSTIDSIATDIKMYEKNLNTLRTQYTELSNNTCGTCGTKLKEIPTDKLNDLKLKGEAIKTAKNKQEVILAKHKKTLAESNPVKLSTRPEDLEASAKALGIEFKGVTEERLEEYEEYKFQMNKFSIYRDDLKDKEAQLKSLNTEIIKDCLSELDKIKTNFTTFLKKKTDKLPVQIELFKAQKNGVIKETFDILYQGKSYNELSTGNKMIVQIMLAEIFADKVGIDFIIIDEGNSISKNNLGYIAELSKRKQVIVMKATPWTTKDIKPKVSKK